MTYGKSGFFNHIEIQIRRVNCAWKVLAWRFSKAEPFNFRYFLEYEDAKDFANRLLKEYKWRL